MPDIQKRRPVAVRAFLADEDKICQIGDPVNFFQKRPLFLAALLVYGIYKVIRRQFIYLILLVILLPASVPILRNIWQALLEILKFLVGDK